MAGSVAQSSTTSGNSAAKPRASKKSAPVKKTGRKTPEEKLYGSLFAELARIAEMSSVERRLRDFGFRCIAGTDEVGRGCLAGPVVAACVILDADPTLFGVNDSKQVAHEDRFDICRVILSRARAVAVGVVEHTTIDRINILRASKLAMLHAVDDLSLRPDVLLLDAVTLEQLEMPQIPLIGGDRRSVSIAAASIVAKVYRDMLMESYDALYPVYGFKHHRGYATEAHQAALKTFGPSPIHRRSFEGVEEPMLLFGSRVEDGGSTR
ncbi:MAG TPA: ribonuclease HII [Thermoanaerobaculia bacterium]|jgi:ribonuclease HII|nr:ribonuclease HII [Thermoanaerobaculia bacterium]